ncbi:hypothetical protein Tco_1308727, partial [Tanacetum coccineum]
FEDQSTISLIEIYFGSYQLPERDVTRIEDKSIRFIKMIHDGGSSDRGYA